MLNTVSLSVTFGPRMSSMVHADASRVTGCPESLLASNIASIVSCRLSARRWILIVCDRATNFGTGSRDDESPDVAKIDASFDTSNLRCKSGYLWVPW
jgi:hypothetical protein